MASLDMKGPYRLTTEKIDEVVTRTSPGNYALGYVQDTTFYVCYVGRSDTDINERLKQWLAKSQINTYTSNLAMRLLQKRHLRKNAEIITNLVRLINLTTNTIPNVQMEPIGNVPCVTFMTELLHLTNEDLGEA